MRRRFPNPSQTEYDQQFDRARKTRSTKTLQSILEWAHEFGVIDLAFYCVSRLERNRQKAA